MSTETKTYKTRAEVLDDPDLTPWQRGRIIEEQNLSDPEPTAPRLDEDGRAYLLGLKSKVKAAQAELATLDKKGKAATDAIPLLSDAVQKLERSLSHDAPETEVLQLLVAKERTTLAHNAAEVASARRQQMRDEEWIPILVRLNTFLDKQFGASQHMRLFLGGPISNQLRDCLTCIERVLEAGSE